jgi:hypothetical protein
VETEIAATGIKKMMTTLASGSQATKKQVDGYDELGISVMQLSRDMQKNGTTAMLDVLQRINQLAPERKVSLVKQLFGEESIAPIMGLINHLDKLKSTLGEINDKNKYAGLVMKEFDIRANTTQNAIQLLKNNFNNVAITIGSVFLPAIATTAAEISKYVQRIVPFIERHKELIKIVGEVILGFTALKVAMISWQLIMTGGLWALLQSLKVILFGVNLSLRTVALAQWLWNAAIAANPLTLVILGITALTSGIVYFFSCTKTGQEAWGTMCSFMQSSFKALFDWFVEKWNWIIEQYTKVKDLFGSNKNNLQAQYNISDSTSKLQHAQGAKSVSNTITYNPSINVTVQGNADKKEIDKAINNHRIDFMSWSRQLQGDKLRFAN